MKDSIANSIMDKIIFRRRCVSCGRVVMYYEFDNQAQACKKCLEREAIDLILHEETAPSEREAYRLSH
jgi:rRNA maturation endonuclease Nob1